MPDCIETRRETRPLPLQARAAPVTSANRQAHTIDVVWTTGEKVRRYDWFRDRFYQEELSLEAGAIRMGRLNSGRAPFLAQHEQTDLKNVLGVVERAWVEGGQHLARVRFSTREEVQAIVRDVEDRILTNISVGYRVYKVEMIEPTDPAGDWLYRVTDYEPVELSLVTIPADSGASTRGQWGARSASGPTFPCEFLEEKRIMEERPNPDPVLAERERVAEIHNRCTRFGLEPEFADRLVSRNCDLDVACRAIVDEVSRRSSAHASINGRIGPGAYLSGARAEDRGGSPTQVIEDMATALVARCGGGQLTERARVYAGMRLPDFNAHLQKVRGHRTLGMSPDDLMSRAMHSTSDFANLLENVGGKLLRQSYDAAPDGVKEVARQVLASDFKPMSRVQLSEAPTLLKVLEGGEFKRGAMGDAKESYSVEAYGRIIGISRQAIVNDDLNAFANMARSLGLAAKEFERNKITSLLTSNPTMNDGGALFNATAITTTGGHANLATGTGSALSATSLATATKTLRLMKGLDGVTPINVTPKYLIVPATLEYTAVQLVANINPTAVADVNPHAGKMQVIVDARLDANSTTAWYVAADKAAVDGLEYAYLDLNPGPQLFTSEGWDVDGIEWKCRFDFGCAAVEWRSLYKANGV